MDVSGAWVVKLSGLRSRGDFRHTVLIDGDREGRYSGSKGDERRIFAPVKSYQGATCLFTLDEQTRSASDGKP